MSETVLLGDIGGTNARFALARRGELTHAHLVCLKGHDYASLEAAVAAYFQTLPEGVARPASACLAIAAPVDHDRVTMTNLAWSFSTSRLRESLNLDDLLVVNDFKAVARSIPEISAEQLHSIGGGRRKPGAPAVVLGPGTGLGVSVLVFADGRPVALQTEGGHIGFAPSDKVELSILELLLNKFDRVSVERLLSGPGLATLYETIAVLRNRAIEPLRPDEVSARALDGSCETCQEALQRFFGILGSVAGDLALAVGAEGGVYIAGGIVPKLLTQIQVSDFRARFESKGRFSQYVANMPTLVVKEPFPGLLGCAALHRDSLT